MREGNAQAKACGGRVRRVILAAAVGGLLAALSAHALIINTTFDSTVTTRSDAASWISAWNYAVGQYQTQFADPITINITFVAGGGLGGSSTNLQFIGGTVPTAGYASMK